MSLGVSFSVSLYLSKIISNLGYGGVAFVTVYDFPTQNAADLTVTFWPALAPGNFLSDRLLLTFPLRKTETFVF